MFYELGSKGYLVKQIQEKLKEKGQDPGALDQIFGAKTKMALVSFQNANGLKEDGIAGIVSLEALGLDVELFKPNLSRDAFKLNLASNLNYYGNLPDDFGVPVLKVCCDTHYEELKCLGYQSQQKFLEAVVHVYQPSGYGTSLCGKGTPEYVRFYLSYDNGGTWEDQGMTSFQAHNIPEGTHGSKHLEYAASLEIDPKERHCWRDQIVQARAILSWNQMPPENQPDWKPVWGNVKDADIVLEPRRNLFITEAIKDLVVKPETLAVPLETIFDPEALVEVKAKEMTLAEIAKEYKNKDIPVKRFAHAELSALKLSEPFVDLASLAANVDIQITPELIAELKEVGDGNTSYEQLTCIGLDPNLPNTLVGVIHIKKPAGYSGTPCKGGSMEYVSFWADRNHNGFYETPLGTASVKVYDLPNMPDTGVYYAVRLPVNFDKYNLRRNCEEPVVLPIRAILSWKKPVSHSNETPTWGNREETLIVVPPKGAGGSMPGQPGKLAIIGGIPVSMINVSGDGETKPGAIFANNNLPADNQGRQCPFGGRVVLQGAPLIGGEYMVEVSETGAVWTPLISKLYLTDEDGFVTAHTPDPITHRYQYKSFEDNVNSLLAHWDTAGNAKWMVRFSSWNHYGQFQGTLTYSVKLLNSGPAADIEITSGSGDCGKFTVTDIIQGKYTATAVGNYLRNYSISVLPNINPGHAGPSPSSGSVKVTNANWSLNTSGMKACGYVIHIGVRDRAIVNSNYNGHYAAHSVGFCLDKKTQ